MVHRHTELRDLLGPVGDLPRRVVEIDEVLVAHVSGIDESAGTAIDLPEDPDLAHLEQRFSAVIVDEDVLEHFVHVVLLAWYPLPEPHQRSIVGIGAWKVYLHPASGGNLGELVAMDLSGKIIWKYRQRATFNSTTLTTAGGLVFIGDWNRYIDAFDVKTGKLLWQTRAGASVQGGIVSYRAGGRQYVAVPVGTGASSWSNQAPSGATPELQRPRHGNAIVVFALPTAPRPRTQ